MKKIYILSAGLLMACFTAEAQIPAVATFEDLNLAPESVWDGSDLSAAFVSGGFKFINNYADYGTYTSWDGFAYANLSKSSYESLDDQFCCCLGHGVNDSHTYAVCYYSAWGGNEPIITEAEGKSFIPTGCYITNSAYAYASMLNGDAYAKKFEADDWFMVTATGYLDKQETTKANYYLAKEGQILNEWAWFDLSVLGTVDEIHFTLSSSDTGEWGMNTPAYFCLDDFGFDLNTTHLSSVNQSAGFHTTYNLMGQPSRQKRGLIIEAGKVVLAQ